MRDAIEIQVCFADKRRAGVVGRDERGAKVGGESAADLGHGFGRKDMRHHGRGIAALTNVPIQLCGVACICKVAACRLRGFERARGRTLCGTISQHEQFGRIHRAHVVYTGDQTTGMFGIKRKSVSDIRRNAALVQRLLYGLCNGVVPLACVAGEDQDFFGRLFHAASSCALRCIRTESAASRGRL